MTVISVEEFRAHLDEYLAAAAQGDVILLRDGKPSVLLRAIAEDDLAPDAFAASPDFWRMIQQRRQEQGIPWEEARKQLDLD